MESTPSRPTLSEASAALRDADAARATLADRIVTPSWFFASMGVAIAVQIAAFAVGLHDANEVANLRLGASGPLLILFGLVEFAAVAGVQLWRFRRLNGVWVGGFASRVVLGTGMAASASYIAALAGAIWAAYGAHWWLVGLWSVVGGAAYALSGRRWMRRYRADPATHARGESVAWLIVLAAAAIGGLALLLLNA